MKLIDTNIFLEILLKQDKSEICKKCLDDNIGSINISDFTLHSIGVILSREKKTETFKIFLSDIFPKTNLLSLPKNKYQELIKASINIGLDFDDSYQYCIAKHFQFRLVTMDKDFKKVNDIKVDFL
ncbi:MAG: PIN domain-containing protein [candidate division KSB1 bacterium]|nr:PIN domain-containing protein [candidate division KSB1 bacterium]